ncbi:hypothetical protein AMS68_003496 [Peltaster fructicola]|uniref:non-specific serine/threonine protein kinase n=1 Tax=Peltaster fructicola TaxID=286661 RepID=A0A6H0XTN7_9PEZI|nr:hypothetical protein AMS68_003496 [Peltaster fructicola]
MAIPKNDPLSPPIGRKSTVSRGTIATQSKQSTPRSQAGATPGASKAVAVKERGSTTSEDSNGRAVRSGHRNDYREKPPSKDGTVQRHAKDVEGLKDYQLGDCVGRGAFGSVYRALNWNTGETVAIKQIKLTDLPKSELNVIMQEIDLLKNLNHANIVKYHGFVKSVENLYIILEFCENGSLHSICKNFGKFPENLVSHYTGQVLHGLHFLHEQGVIHRDIKGANILTTKEGLVKLADFGVATKQAGPTEGSVVGSPYWMAPEVIELSGATTASDIWSLGSTVIELLDGKPPYHKLAPMPALFRIVNDDHPPLPEGASPLVRDFLMQCFQKEPNLRVTAKKLLRHPWIVSTKRAAAQKPTEYDNAVKSVQEWNEALKSSPPHVNGTSRRSSTRNKSRSPLPPHIDTQVRPAHDMGKARRKPAGDVFHSPEEESDDNWDKDFETAISPAALSQLPHLRPHDNFAGQLTAEKLKQYASFEGSQDSDGKVEQWDGEFEGDLTVRSPAPKAGVARHTTSTAIKESAPKTQILRGNKTPLADRIRKPVSSAKKASTQSPASFEEVDDDDYSDLVPVDDAAFRLKLAAFQPSKTAHPAELRDLHLKMMNSLRRSSPRLVHDAAAIRRTRSSLEIQKYAEDDADEDFTDLHFGDSDNTPVSLHAFTKSKSPSAPSNSTSGSEHGTLKIGSSSWIEDDEEEDDPFAALEEELDDVDLELNVARDKHARLCMSVGNLVSDLKLDQPSDVLAEIIDQLLIVLSEGQELRDVVVSSHGMLPILEILDSCERPLMILKLLRIVNLIISNDDEVSENLCFIGGIPIISKFAHKKFSSDIRLEAANFVRAMYQTSNLTLQMFVSCGGLNVLVEFLDEDYESEYGRELVLTGVDGVWSVFEMQSATPKNDFCRILSRSSVLYPLSLVLKRVLDEEGEQAELIEGRIVNIFLLFSQAENYVKETIADRMVLKHVLKDLRRMSPAHQITMLKFIKNLSMLATTLGPLQNSNAIEVLTDLLSSSMKLPHFREVSNQVLNTMFNLCRLSKARQEDAALSGVIPLLQRIVKTERPLKEFALPILCDMAHSGTVGRKLLWQNKGLHFYITLLADQYWAVTALDAIFIWLQEETAKVEEHLLSSSAFSEAIICCFNESKADAFENMLEPLQKLLRLSPPVAASLAHPDLFSRTIQRLHSKKPVVRLNLLRVIRSICDASEEQGALLRTYGLLESVAELAMNDPAILVREMAGELVRSSQYNGRRTLEIRPVRRSSSSTMTPPVSSVPPTPDSERAGGRGYFDFGAELARARQPGPSPYRPMSRDGSSGSSRQSFSSSSKWGGVPSATAAGSVAGKSRLTRAAVAPVTRRANSRLSLAPVPDVEPRGKADTGTPSPLPAITGSRGAAYAPRRRRQTSGAELGR